MKRLTLAALAACCALVMAFAGCSTGGAKATDADSLKGFWEIDPASPMGFDAALNLDDEDFAELQMGDAYLEGTWKADGSTASIDFDGKSVSIYVSGDKLTLGQDDGSKLVFVKSNIEDYYAADDGVELGSEGSEDGVEVEGLEGLEDGEIEGLDSSEDVEVVPEAIDDIAPVTVADDKVVKIEVTGKGTDFTSDPGYRLSITNKADKTIFIVADDLFKVNGKDIEAGLGEVLEPGETLESFMYFEKDDLGGGLEALKKVEGTIFVGDDDTEDELGTYTFKMD